MAIVLGTQNKWRMRDMDMTVPNGRGIFNRIIHHGRSGPTVEKVRGFKAQVR